MYKTGSPPPAGSKKVVPKWRSVSSIVKAPAKTGIDSSKRNAVTRIAQTKIGKRSIRWCAPRIVRIVVIKLMALKSLPPPATCKLKIPRSTAGLPE